MNKTKMIIIVLYFLIFSLKMTLYARIAVLFEEKFPYAIPELTKLSTLELQGQKLQIRLPYSFETFFFPMSRRYCLPFNKNGKLFARIVEFESYRTDKWFCYQNEIKDYSVLYHNNYKTSQYNQIYLDENNKVIKISRKRSYGFPIDNMLLHHTDYYIPDKYIKPGDMWEYNFIDESLNYNNKRGDKPRDYVNRYDGEFILIGYTNYENIRCALIESTINYEIIYRTQYNNKLFKKKGGAILLTGVKRSLLYLDVKNSKILFLKTSFIQKGKGNYFKNWGKTLEEVRENIIKEYDGNINGYYSYIAQYFIKYHYPDND